jgi:hypothetical protein
MADVLFPGIDIDVDPGAAALADAFAQGIVWICSYLEAPSHRDSGWRPYAELKASGLNIWPGWVGGQVTGRGSHLVSAAAGAAEAKACADELDAKGYPPEIGVFFDTENGAPIRPEQEAHLIAWRDGLKARGRHPQAYGSHENFEELAAIFGIDDVFEFDVRGTPPQTFPGIAVQYAQNVKMVLAGVVYDVDRSVAKVADPARAPAGFVPIPIPAPAPVEPAPQPAPAPLPIAPLPAVPKAPIVVKQAPAVAAGTAGVGIGTMIAQQALTSVDFTHLIDKDWPLIFNGIIAVALIYAIGRALQFLHLQRSPAVDAVIARGVAAVGDEVQAWADAHPDIDVKNAQVAAVMRYAITAIPDKLSQLGVTQTQLANLTLAELAKVKS